MQFDCTFRTHVGHRRKLNEDSLLCSGEQSIWVVADGMGGHDAGEIASRMVVDALENLPAATSFANRVGKAIGALETVNAQLIEMALTAGEGRTIGTTVVGILAEGPEYCCFWVGDSRAYRIRGRSIARLTRDHSLVQDLVDAGMLEAERADEHPNANVLTRAVGAALDLKVDTAPGMLEAGDTLLLASDGLTRLVREDEFVSELEHSGPDEAADRLLAKALARGAPDNVTLVIVKAH